MNACYYYQLAYARCYLSPFQISEYGFISIQCSSKTIPSDALVFLILIEIGRFTQ